ncbi:phage protein [Paenibacillus baekrokdamisoli]|uniref:Phage protein n=1 Tax=Paenibacillus baekrokdamisoli TaxID=1712516 RepID=A0A3G9IUU6_9BACL|nr:DUF2577 domain-containing protein [Paenibacillus baekrokdamisoli]MBB3070485.1 hypothetical protein [Paenibacillus baekrokdamisoli]BBH19835.1 phage protein [Paenibacillus baekrokdamisoli]
MSLLGVIKKAGLGAVEAGQPITVQTGSVTKADPLEVTVDQRFTLTADFLIVPESLMEYKIDVKHAHSYSEGVTGDALKDKLLIRRGLGQGDKLILLRVQGGQQYLILDRVI